MNLLKISARIHIRGVSFVGDTGFGKSTLVRAIILMGKVEALGLYRETVSRRVSVIGSTSRGDVSMLNDILDAGLHGPVPRTTNLTHANEATSSGFHLYRDPTNSNAEYTQSDPASGKIPILFADCEGFQGRHCQN